MLGRWHNAYYNLGFLSYDNPEFPKNNDSYSLKKLKVNSKIIPFTKDMKNYSCKNTLNL